MSGKGLLIGGLLVMAMTTVVPAPRFSIDNPKVLYGAAIYKAIVGDAGSAMRLLQRAEDGEKPAPTPAPHAALRCTRTATRG